LLFRDGYNSGWEAIIDGNKQEVIQANYNQKAVFIEEGVHQVRFVFKPLAYIISLYIYFIFSTAVIIYIIYYFIKKKKHK
jgi:uncharacterized membrane protein YfhO